MEQQSRNVEQQSSVEQECSVEQESSSVEQEHGAGAGRRSVAWDSLGVWTTVQKEEVSHPVYHQDRATA